MGRQVMRVPLDFVWPREKVWKGYISPFDRLWMECPECNASGFSTEYQQLQKFWYGSSPYNDTPSPVMDFEKGLVSFGTVYCGDGTSFEFTRKCVGMNSHAVDLGVKHHRRFEHNDVTIVMPASEELRRWVFLKLNSGWSHMLDDDDVAELLKGNRLWDFTRDWSIETGWVDKNPPVIPTAEEVNAASLRGWLHDSINQTIVIYGYLDRHKLPRECPHCNGEGGRYPDEETAKAAKEWKREKPPTGPGYQIWEDVTEGSPISPVFEKPEDLAQWMSRNPRGSDEGTSAESWLEFINGPGWAPSFVMSGGVMMSGVEHAAKHAHGKEPEEEPHE
jgi:hypothetical protein